MLLPQAPEVEQRSEVVDNVTATIYAAAASTNDYEIAAVEHRVPERARTRARERRCWTRRSTGGVSGVNGKLVRKSLLTHDTLPAIEGRFDAPDGYRADVLIVASGSRLIMLLVHAKTGTDRLYKALEDAEQSTRGCAVAQDPACADSNSPDVMSYHDVCEIPNYWTYGTTSRSTTTCSSPSRRGLPDHLYMVSVWRRRRARRRRRRVAGTTSSGPPDAGVPSRHGVVR